MSNVSIKGIAAAFVALAANILPANAGCDEDVAAAFAKQRETKAYRMKTRQISPHGLVNMTIDYLLPYKMHQKSSSMTTSGPGTRELILIGKRSWYSTGLEWTLMSAEETEGLNKQFGAAVLAPQEDEMTYECLGQMDVDSRTVVAYLGKQGNSDNVRTDTAVLRTIHIDPETGLPLRASVARADKPDLAFFKADYTYPKDIVIVPPKNVKAAAPAPKAKPPKPNQSTAP